jgi:hypothetical protein
MEFFHFEFHILSVLSPPYKKENMHRMERFINFYNALYISFFSQTKTAENNCAAAIDYELFSAKQKKRTSKL